MRLKTRLSKDILKTGGVFIFVTVVMSIIFFQFNAIVNTQIAQAVPALGAMGTLIEGVHDDTRLISEYLQSSDVNVELEGQVEEATLRTSEVLSEISLLAQRNVIRDEEVLRQLIKARRLNSEVESARDEIFALHKQDLETPADLSFDKNVLLTLHNEKLNSATAQFSLVIRSINARNALLQEQLLVQSRIYFGLMLTLFISFLVIVSFKIRKISKEVITPIDDTITKTREFVEGKYNTTIAPSEDIFEIKDLQRNINNVFSVIKESAQNPVQKRRIDELLRPEHINILDFLEQNTALGKKVSITDLKKFLNVTHPTVLSRINYLLEKGYITVEKNGRDKFLYLN